MSAPNPAEVITEALGAHQHGAPVPASLRAECDKHLACLCGWVSSQCKTMTAREEFRKHQASVIAALPDIAIVTLPTIREDENLVDYHGRLEVALGGVRFQAYVRARDSLSAGGES